MMKKLQIIKIDKANDFAGIKINSDGVFIHVPGFFRVESDDRTHRKNLLLFLRSIEIAKKIDKEALNKQDMGESSWPIDSFLWIIRDFLENGYYYNRERQFFFDGKGKIDWKKTIRTTPIVSKGNIIYDHLITSRISPQEEEITKIYKICLKKACDCISWIIPSYNLQINAQQTKSISEMIRIVRKELSNTFDDTKRARFNHMIRVLMGSDSKKLLSETYTYGIYNYYYVFEKMVDEFLQGIKGEERKKYNPNGYWSLNNMTTFKSSNLRPDTIYKRGGKTFIIDSKMYQFGVTGEFDDLPKTSSMQKQITYGDYVMNTIEKGCDVRNAFILPYDKSLSRFRKLTIPCIEKVKGSDVVYIGFATVDWRDGEKPSDHDRIYTFMIDFNFLLNNYKEDDSSYIDAICDEINQKAEFLKKKDPAETYYY